MKRRKNKFSCFLCKEVRQRVKEYDSLIRELISDVPIQGKKYVLKYLKSFEPDCAAGMSLIDEITGKAVGTGVNGYGDLEFFWDSREIYHFEKYNLELNQDFLKYILKK